MKENILALRPVHLTKQWAQRVVDQQAAGTRVYGVELDSVDVGTTTRVRLSIEHDGSGNLPKRWFVKLPSLDYRARAITALPRLLHTEMRFYQEIAPAVPVNRPAVLAAQSRLGMGVMLVLSDVTESGATPGNPCDALSVPQALSVIEHLAYFHARFWNRVQHDHRYLWLAGPVRRLEDNLGTLLAVPLMKRGLKLAGDLVPVALHDSILRYAKNRKKAMHFLSDGVPTLTHHDCHPGNLFWRNLEPGFLDWQMVRIGEGVGDVAYFLATALEPELRRQYEPRFLETYRQSLAEKGIENLSMHSLMQRYRAHLAYAFEAMILTLAVGGLMPLASNLELIRRTAKAVEDHDAFVMLPID